MTFSTTVTFPATINNILLQLPPVPTRVKKSAIALIPKVLKPVISRLPIKWQSLCLLPLLEKVFADALFEGDFDFLYNRWLAIEITDLSLTWYLSFNGEKLILSEDNSPGFAAQVDVTFAANGDDLLLIAGRKEDPDTLFFQRRLAISGDTELGVEVKNLIDNIDTDLLPKQINQVIQSLSSWLNEYKKEINNKDKGSDNE